MNWLGILLVFCSFIALAHFVFIVKYAVRTELVISTAFFILLMAIGLFSWAMMTTLRGSGGYDPWLNIAYLCSLLAFPILIYIFIQRADSQSFIVTQVKGRILLFFPVMVQLIAHYVLPTGPSKFMDTAFMIGWLGITLMIWYRLYKKTHEFSSHILKNQMEFMLSSFFVVLIYDLIIIFLILSPYSIVQYGFIYAIGLTVALLNTVRGIVKYQLDTGIELFYRHGLILMVRSIITLTIFIIMEVVILSFVQDMGDYSHILVSAGIMIVIVLSINMINDFSTTIVESISPDLKWRESQIKEIFVIMDSGLVLGHASHYSNEEVIDKDLVGGMLSAIQNFLTEAFDASEKETLKSLRMGDMSMLLEHHKSISIVVLFNGFEARELRVDIKGLSKKIHEEFDDIIKEWNGTMSEVAGIQSIIDEFMDSNE